MPVDEMKLVAAQRRMHRQAELARRPVEDVFRAARPGRGARRAALWIACAVAVAATTGTIATRSAGVHVAAGGSSAVLGWPPRGPLARDALVTSRAADAWTAEADSPRHDVSVLFAAPDSQTGVVVVLQGLDSDGKGHVAFVTGDFGRYTDPVATDSIALGLRSDHVIEQPRSVDEVSVLLRRLGRAGAAPDPYMLVADKNTLTDRALVLALAEPGASVALTSTAWDSYSDTDGFQHGFLSSVVPEVATPSNVSLAVRSRSGTKSRHVDGWGYHDFDAVGGAVRGVSVDYLPAGFLPDATTIGSGYESRSYRRGSATLTIRVAQAGSSPAQEWGSVDGPASAHGGIPARFVADNSGTLALRWAEEGLVFSVEAAATGLDRGRAELLLHDVSQGLRTTS